MFEVSPYTLSVYAVTYLNPFRPGGSEHSSLLKSSAVAVVKGS